MGVIRLARFNDMLSGRQNAVVVATLEDCTLALPRRNVSVAYVSLGGPMYPIICHFLAPFGPIWLVDPEFRAGMVTVPVATNVRQNLYTRFSCS